MSLAGLLHRAAMKKKGATGYITDGLVLYLDGINKGSTPNAWSNLVGDEVFENIAATSISDGWRFDGSGGLTKSGPLVSTDVGSDSPRTHTIEIVLDTNNNKTMIMLASGNETGLVLGYYGSAGHIISGTSLVAYQTQVADKRRVLSVNSGQAMENGIVLESVSETYFSGSVGNKSTIGYRDRYSVNNPFIGDILCIRIYNRLLTEQEMRHNQIIDNERFNIGLQ